MNPKLLIIAICMLLLISNIVLAVPGQSNSFYGSVLINGSPAPDGTIVTAEINGIQVADTITSGGRYGYPGDSFDVEDPNSALAGKEIKFFVNGVDTKQTAFFVNGNIVELDLSVVIESSSGGAPSGGSGGTAPSSSGTTTPTTTGGTTQTDEGCQERWTCSDWGACENGLQTRTCVDENECGTNSREPFSSQPCTTVLSSTEETASSPIGFFTLSSSDLLLAGVIGVVVAIVVILFLKMRKPKSIVHVVKMDQSNQKNQAAENTGHVEQTDPSKSSGIEP